MRLFFLICFIVQSLIACSSNPATPAPLLDLSYDRSQFLYHEVLRYETLDDIESVYGVDKAVIKKTNDLNKKHPMRPGMLLRIPEYFALSTQKQPTKKRSERFQLPKQWGEIVHSKYTTQKDQRGGWKIYTNHSVSIYAPANGKVIEISDSVKDLGRVVIVRHSNQYTSIYGLVSETVVKKGQILKKNEMIGRAINNNDGKSMLYYRLKKNV